MKALACLLLVAMCSANAEVRFANIPEGKVRYENWGKGEKALVFVHGWTCSGAFWKSNVDGLKDKWRVIAVDLPGHGGSDKPDVPYTMALMAKGVEAVMHDAGVKKVVLVGHSMGSPVIRQAYADAPESIAALVIVDGSVARRNAVQQDRSAMFREMRENYRPTVSKSIESMFSAKTSPELRKQIMDWMLATPEHVGVSAREGLQATKVWDSDPVAVPTLAIFQGGRTDEVLKTHFTNLEFEAWPGYGHFLMMEDPGRFNARVRQFLQKIGF